MTFDLKAQPASISSAICGLRRIIIVFSFFQTNKMEMEMENCVNAVALRVSCRVRGICEGFRNEQKQKHLLYDQI